MNPDIITEKIIGCAYSVSNELGAGFLEKVYENALYVELAKKGLQVEQQFSIVVRYHGHQAQLLSYLKATGIRTGLLFNFGTARLGIKRMVFGTEKNNEATDRYRCAQIQSKPIHYSFPVSSVSIYGSRRFACK